jgi:hypothetical protein
MRSSRITTLFTEPLPVQRSPSSIAVSIVVHCIAIVWLYLGLRHAPRLNDQSFVRRFTVRLLKQDSIQEPMTKRYPGSAPTPSARRNDAQAASAGGQPLPQPSVTPQLPELLSHTQTLVQPEVPPDLALLQPVPVPTVIRWAPVDVPQKVIVLPLPKVLSAADIHSSLTPPNHEQTPADIKISSTKFSTQAPVLPPSTTSPIVVRRAEAVKQAPESTSQSLAEPTPAQVISLSDLRLKEGSVSIPAANAAARSKTSDPLVPGQSTATTSGGNGNPTSKANGSGNGQSSGTQGDKSTPGSGSTALSGTDTGANQGVANGSGSGSEPAIAHITVPKDGQFGVVVIGSSLAEQYPEIVSIWGGRMVYTVYLHVGLGKSWILQYSIPRSTDPAAAAITPKPEAPWPYDIFRPTLAPADYNSDAIMVHGFVNLTGRFEQLAVVFPPEFPQSKFVLGALQQWRFRPARQSGQAASVEILLIIPEMTEE